MVCVIRPYLYIDSLPEYVWATSKNSTGFSCGFREEKAQIPFTFCCSLSSLFPILRDCLSSFLPASLHHSLSPTILHSSPSLQVPVKAIQGGLYVRVSAHVHNTVGEYEALATAVLSIISKHEATQPTIP